MALSKENGIKEISGQFNELGINYISITDSKENKIDVGVEDSSSETFSFQVSSS